MHRLDAQFAGVMRRMDIDRFVVKVDLTARQRMVAGQHLDQGRFAGAVIAEQADDLLAIDVEINAAQHLYAAEILVDINHIHQGVIVFLLVFHENAF